MEKTSSVREWCVRNILWIFTLLVSMSGVGAQDQAGTETDSDPAELSFSTSTLELRLDRNAGTVRSLGPAADPEFDYTPGDLYKKRSSDGHYHLGDLNIRLRSGGESSWRSYSTAASRKSVETLAADSPELLHASALNATLPADFPLRLRRFWEKKEDHLLLRFELYNPGREAITVGALGIPMIFNNNLDGRSLDEAHEKCVFSDPYIGTHAGYLQVVRLKGEGQVLLVLPWGESGFEAYRPLLDDPTRRGITFEGFHEWMCHSRAYAEEEWKDAQAWNTPTSVEIPPGGRYEVGVEFLLAPSVQEIEQTLAARGRPVAIGIPGYVLPMDVEASLFLKAGSEILAYQTEPAGSLEIRRLSQTDSGWIKYAVRGKRWGRARLSIEYADGKEQSIHYKIIKAEAEVVADNGKFLTTEQWFDAKDDLFGRAPSVISYDIERRQQVREDSRAWIAGLSDEGGAGSWLNAVMKQLILPDPGEVTKMETFIHETLWGGIQYDTGSVKYGVRKSMFYHDPDKLPEYTYSDSINYDTWAAWPLEEAMSVGRSYNYPHVAAAYWVMYRLGRNYEGLVKRADWNWYLEHAFQTAMAMVSQAPHYARFGQMEGSVFLFLLEDLKHEGKVEMANQLEKAMKTRAMHWASLNYPFGSEMPWDSTGQEEVYMWSRYFAYSEKAMVTLKAILAYMPTVPHWAYNGNARRYWDFLYGGKLSRIERQIHHYGSALNAIPVLHDYKFHSGQLYSLRVGYGGLMGALSNITQEGFAPCAFHSFPSTLEIDGISGDYGPGFYGYAVSSCTVLERDKELGWLAFGANLEEDGEWIEAELTTAAGSRVFIGPENLWITLDAGRIRKLSYRPGDGSIRLYLSASNDYTPKAFLRVEGREPVFSEAHYRKTGRGSWEIPLGKQEMELSF